MTSFGLKQEVIEQIKVVIARCSKVTRAVIFGSRAKGNYKKYSDIDICLFGKVSSEEAEWVRSELDELNVIYEFDVVSFEEVKSDELKEHIVRCGVEFYSRKDRL